MQHRYFSVNWKLFLQRAQHFHSALPWERPLCSVILGVPNLGLNLKNSSLSTPRSFKTRVKLDFPTISLATQNRVWWFCIVCFRSSKNRSVRASFTPFCTFKNMHIKKNAIGITTCRLEDYALPTMNQWQPPLPSVLVSYYCINPLICCLQGNTLQHSALCNIPVLRSQNSNILNRDQWWLSLFVWFHMAVGPWKLGYPESHDWPVWRVTCLGGCGSTVQRTAPAIRRYWSYHQLKDVVRLARHTDACWVYSWQLCNDTKQCEQQRTVCLLHVHNSYWIWIASTQL